jgi:hypothetical protein
VNPVAGVGSWDVEDGGEHIRLLTRLIRQAMVERLDDDMDEHGRLRTGPGIWLSDRGGTRRPI